MKPKVLIVDDEAVIREFVKIYLEGIGYDPGISAAAAAAAVAAAGPDSDDTTLLAGALSILRGAAA